jgi:selenocysteine lyase/cysteine desulfurase
MSFETILGAGVAAQVLTEWDRAEVLARERRLLDRLRTRLAGNPAVRLLGPAGVAAGSPLLTFQVAGLPAGAVARWLGGRGIAVTHGTFYAAAAMRAVAPEQPEAVRAGIAYYTTDDDVSALADAVDELTGRPA